MNRDVAGAVSFASSTCSDEQYDAFDGDAVKLGEVDVGALLASESMVQGQNRRVTSQRLISQTRFSGTIKPPKKEGTLEKYSPALFRSWQSRHVEINEGILKYYKEVNGTMKNQGTLNFDLYCCFITLDSKNTK